MLCYVMLNVDSLDYLCKLISVCISYESYTFFNPPVYNALRCISSFDALVINNAPQLYPRMTLDTVLELRGGGPRGLAPLALSSGSAPDLHYGLALRASHMAPLKTFK